MLIEIEKSGNVQEFQASIAVDIPSEESLMIQLNDETRKLSEIAADFEDADTIRIEDGREYDKYGNVIVVYRMNRSIVQIRVKEGTSGE